MFALRDLQAAFADHVTGVDRAGLVAVVAGDTIAAEARLRIYRHHVLQSLASALAATYPTVQALVGEDFFRVMARTFVVQDLPRQPVLAEYGAGFPAFVGAYRPGATLPYLADIARLDWALNSAFHSPDGGRLTAGDLASLPGDQVLGLLLALAPGAALLRSAYPLDRIWRASQPGAPDDPVDLGAGGADLLVLRRPDDAAFVSLGAGEAAFVGAIAGGDALEVAARAGLRAEAAFDLSTSFARLLTLQAFAALQ